MLTDSGIAFEVHGSGTPLFLGFPLMASYGEIFGADQQHVLVRFLEGLTDDYAVVVADYPSIGRSASIDPDELTVDRACADLLAVADAAGFERFAWWGYAWGGILGLQLASRTDRVSALAIGGWSPIAGAFEGMLEATRHNLANPAPHALQVLRDPAQYRQWVTFYESIIGLDEQAVLDAISCPRMVVVGAEGDVAPAGVPIRNASLVREHRAALEEQGWQVEVVPGQGHGLGLDASAVLPLLRPFLDASTTVQASP